MLCGLLLLLSSLAPRGSQAAAAAPPTFGHSLLPLFQMEPNYTNLNHGSYGSVPSSVTAAATAAEVAVERNPDRFFRYQVWDTVDAVRKAMAAFLSCSWLDLVFVPNASVGVNTVLRSLALPAGKAGAPGGTAR